MDAIIARNIIELAGAMMEEFESVWTKINKIDPSQVNYRIMKLYLIHIKEQRNLIVKAISFDSHNFPNLLTIRKCFLQKFIEFVPAVQTYLIKFKEFDIDQSKILRIMKVIIL
ncbi:hypothetical protein APICC_07351 [Apis cerana cerana]|uniref:Uncharacterized protein n=1 Tax=Apis cerana cerana TaxID=94128 RepID=A0A2A3E215_APICC|nr:hypothetical protein APICC_07351 [Apis cerana cerana]